MADNTTDPALAALATASANAMTNAQNLRARLIGLETARPTFMANNSFADLKVYDQDIEDAKLAVEQADVQLRAAQTAQFDALYLEEQKQKAVLFASTNLTNSIFWLKFSDEYMIAAARMMAILEAGEIMCRQVATINAESKPDNVQPIPYAVNVIDWIKAKLYIPSADGSASYFGYRQRTVQYPEGTDPVGDFLKEVIDSSNTALNAATGA